MPKLYQVSPHPVDRPFHRPVHSSFQRRFQRAFVPFAALSLVACAGTYTGPVEVTRFVAEDTSQLGKGSIAVAIRTGEDADSEILDTIYSNAIVSELQNLGYTVSLDEKPAQQAFATVSVRQIIRSGGNSAAGVSIGGQTGSFGSGLGIGLGLALGGGNKDREATTMEVRITSAETGKALWEGRAEIIASVDSKYSVSTENARALAAALFKDFPGGNGETVQLSVDELERTP
ncbi:DUF4136 domain-containing protein [Erythrobacter insulae]|uniref:DUF4136 domain-containing protein n=1 Tax=Erythrobacter insulae TaxID=2584124 RepID=A0A547PCC8_9SPHN|nr:DUF4136 domain-containing protein [Erythrobacter insulae]TRD11694.1 DUF4136 domain-containing protein [Erythrobacter insulae]